MGISLAFIVLPSLGVCAEPKPQGTLNMAVVSLAAEGFLPDVGTVDQARAWVIVYDYPFYFNKKLERIPGLATRYEYSKDHLTLTLYLRKGVPWQGDWGEVTADDVKYTYERIAKSLNNVITQNLKASVKDIKVVDRYTVAFHLKRPSPELWASLFGGQTMSAPILCKKYIETVGEEKARANPIGSGPYRLVEHKPGQYMKFEAVEKHWRVVPEFKYLYLRIVPEESTRVAMLKTGEIDITQIVAQSMASFEGNPDITTMNWVGGYSLMGCFGGMITPADKRFKKGYHQTDPWTNIKVREAMNLAIDRWAIVKAIYKGTARPMPIAWPLPGYEDLPPIPYDPTKAKRLLAEAGYPNGFKLKVLAVTEWTPALEMPKVMEIVAAYFEGIGLKPEIVQIEKQVSQLQSRAAKDVGMIFPWSETYKTSMSGYHYQKFSANATSPIYQSDELTALINEYEAELDEGKREAALGKVRDYHYKNFATIPLVQAMPIWAYRNKKISGWPESPIDRQIFLEYVRHVKPLNTYRLFTP